MIGMNYSNLPPRINIRSKSSPRLFKRFNLNRRNQIADTMLNEIGTETEDQPKPDENARLDGLVDICEEPLLRIQTVFPFVFFTNEVIVDVDKVSIIYRDFFDSKQVHSVLIKDISDVIVETNPFFATLKIVDVGYVENSIDINYLKKSEGKHARETIQGLMTVHRHGIDLTKVAKKDLLEKLESLGSNGSSV